VSARSASSGAFDRPHIRLERGRHAGKYSGIDPVCFGECSGGLSKAPGPQRVDPDQRLLEDAMIDASGFIGNPLNLPLLGPLQQGDKARWSVGELAGIAARVSMGIKMLFGDVDAEGLW